jgi:hypothetical protein
MLRHLILFSDITHPTHVPASAFSPYFPQHVGGVAQPGQRCHDRGNTLARIDPAHTHVARNAMVFEKGEHRDLNCDVVKHDLVKQDPSFRL